MKGILTKKRAVSIIEGFPRAKVLVVGDIMVDHFIWGRVSRISPEAPVPVVEVQSDNLLLGGCANVLNNVYAMGGQVFGAGVVGRDPMGDRVVDEFRKRGIDIGGVVQEDERPTTLKTRIVAHSQQVVRFDRESRRSVAAASIERILSYIRSLRGELGAVVISDYNKGVVTRELLDGIRQALAGGHTVVCVDPKQNDFSLYRGFDVITPNHHEAARAFGTEHIHGSDLVNVGNALLERYGFQALLVTRGEAGMSLFERDGRIRHTFFPTQAKEVFDVTGAGDTVIGVFALAVASGATFREAAFLANYAAGIVVGKVGTATVSQQELKRVL
ncbi:MAG TPA: D-glycero-beta-D-manno-heptose-7-phosphate kinase [Syntrophales bacterium]|nr:D-glycero-beta-D-manno-heptose-7-phosphate kinase [Syntrophales bacterium]